MRWIWTAALLGACQPGEPTPEVIVSDQPVEEVGCIEGVEVGQCPPDFTLTSTDGTQITLSEAIGTRILVFGTSNW